MDVGETRAPVCNQRSRRLRRWGKSGSGRPRVILELRQLAVEVLYLVIVQVYWELLAWSCSYNILTHLTVILAPAESPARMISDGS